MVKKENEALALAKWSLDFNVKGLKDIPKPEFTDPYLTKKAGVFVTLKKNGMLCGCIGIIQPVDILAENIITSARNSALSDWRFPNVTSEEVDELEVEISVLSVPEESKLGDIQIGKHGLIVEGAGKSAIYLPQVATEQGWNFGQWLDSICDKAGLIPRFWLDAEAKFKTFTAQIINEKK